MDEQMLVFKVAIIFILKSALMHIYVMNINCGLII